jgi:hypothetical protein
MALRFQPCELPQHQRGVQHSHNALTRSLALDPADSLARSRQLSSSLNDMTHTPLYNVCTQVHALAPTPQSIVHSPNSLWPTDEQTQHTHTTHRKKRPAERAFDVINRLDFVSTAHRNNAPHRTAPRCIHHDIQARSNAPHTHLTDCRSPHTAVAFPSLFSREQSEVERVYASSAGGEGGTGGSADADAAEAEATSGATGKSRAEMIQNIG